MVEPDKGVVRIAGVFVLAALLSACGGSIPRVSAPAELGGVQVTVALAPEIESDRARVFQEQDRVARLRNAVLDEMIAHPGLTPADEMHLLVTRFRLRQRPACGSARWLVPTCST